MDIDEVIRMIDGKMEGGVSRLKVAVDEGQDENVPVEQYHHGRCDVGSPWATGTVRNCDVIDTPAEPDKKP